MIEPGPDWDNKESDSNDEIELGGMGQMWMWKKDKFPGKEMIIKRSLSLRTRKGNIRPIHLQQPRWPGLGRET